MAWVQTTEPPVFGDNCVGCDDVLWNPGETPMFVKLEVRDLVGCPGAPAAAPNGDWILSQDAIDPCKWEYLDSLYWFVMNIAAIASNLRISEPPVANWGYFLDNTGGCPSVFANELVACGGFTASINGTVTVLW